MATSRTGIKSKPLSVSEKLNTINKVDCVPNVSRTKKHWRSRHFCEKGINKLLGWWDTGENTLRPLKVTRIQHIFML